MKQPFDDYVIFTPEDKGIDAAVSAARRAFAGIRVMTVPRAMLGQANPWATGPDTSIQAAINRLLTTQRE